MSSNAGELNERDWREEAFRRWSLAWQPMDADTIDAYVEATADQPREVLVEALRKLARTHEGSFRPAPAKVIDRCYAVRIELRDAAARERQLEASNHRLGPVDRLGIWQRCIDRARAQGFTDDAARIRFWQRGVDKLRASANAKDPLVDFAR